MKPFKTGQIKRINRKRDLECMGEIKPYVGQLVGIVQHNKSGMYQVRCTDGTLLEIAKYNLDNYGEKV